MRNTVITNISNTAMNTMLNEVKKASYVCGRADGYWRGYKLGAVIGTAFGASAALIIKDVYDDIQTKKRCKKMREETMKNN